MRINGVGTTAADRLLRSRRLEQDEKQGQG